MCLPTARHAIYMRSCDSKQSHTHFTQVFPQQPTGNVCQLCNNVSGTVENLRSHMRDTELMSIAKTVLLFVTYVAGLERIKLARGVTGVPRIEEMAFFC